jgi:hypothetical protein
LCCKTPRSPSFFSRAGSVGARSLKRSNRRRTPVAHASGSQVFVLEGTNGGRRPILLDAVAQFPGNSRRAPAWGRGWDGRSRRTRLGIRQASVRRNVWVPLLARPAVGSGTRRALLGKASSGTRAKYEAGAATA